MFCKKCGKEIQDDSQFCPYCGASLASSFKVQKQKVEKCRETENKGVHAVQKKNSVNIKVIIIVVLAFIAGVVTVRVRLGTNEDRKLTDQKSAAVMTEQESEDSSEIGVEETVLEVSEVKLAIPFSEGRGTEKSEGISPDEYILPECENRVYTKEEISSLSIEELRLARNEIYARHGRIFTSDDLKNYFQNKSWYTPLYEAGDFDAKGDSMLNEYEIANRNLIVELENENKLMDVESNIKIPYAGVEGSAIILNSQLLETQFIEKDKYDILTGEEMCQETEGDAWPSWEYTGDIYISKDARFNFQMYESCYYENEASNNTSVISIENITFEEFWKFMIRTKNICGYSFPIVLKFDENGFVISGYSKIAG